MTFLRVRDRPTALVLLTALACGIGGCSSASPAHTRVSGAVLDSATYDAVVREGGAAVLADTFRADSFRAGGIALPYRVVAPGAVVRGERYPLVLVLHGSGAIGGDNRSQLGPFARAWARPDIRARFPAYVVVPQFATRSAVYAPDPDDGMPSSLGTPALNAAFSLVERLRDSLPVDSARIYVVGFSMGASAAWQALVRRPGLFAAAVPVGGVPPRRALAASLARVPVLVVHGSADDENPFGAARAMYDALRRAGSRRVALREYVRLGHQVPAAFVADTGWRVWLFAQRRATQ